ncbi:MAG: phosphopantothenoylcysteine decarboxylase [Planctomycetes bacterium]|nr:phosphopantothenoylcysteine decarboxylase [Planctomycetota bacterium]MCB9890461.1 phosphopantothenoylcysteine decarboxylase [Planctomycetota bacterium]MCB9917702.1 phosphopantothenoylcysteine decarboxylase [Planctomycetota bacterium]
MWLLTSGPTREHLDSVRFLTNASSGRMGFAIAEAALARDHEVTIVQGPVALSPPPRAHVLPVVSAIEMLESAALVLERGDVEALIGVAAVCDFRPARKLAGKPAKSAVPRQLDLVLNPDVLAELTARRLARVHIGFALQSMRTPEEERVAFSAARSKLARKGLDAIVLNGAAAMESDASHAYWIPARGEDVDLGVADKTVHARRLVACIEELLVRR